MTDSERICAALEDWGARRVEMYESFSHVEEDQVTIDFQTPMPGDQPIRSSLLVGEDNGVVKSTARLGVLDGAYFPEHPTDDPQQLARLRETVRTTSFPNGALVVANYGDTHRTPRPHVLVGWIPSMASAGEETVAEGDSEYRPDALDLIAYYREAARAIRRGFRGEWADE